MPLWVAYELLRMTYVPHQMNLAESMMTDALGQLPPMLFNGFRIALLIAVLVAARSIYVREIPWLRVGLVILLEGAVYGLMLGPIADQMTQHLLPLASTAPGAAAAAGGSRLIGDLIGSLGAGIYEELLFRLLLMSLMAWLFLRVTESFSLPKGLGVTAALVASSLLFALFHYGLPGALEPPAFLFRTLAGMILGLLFLLRGIGVCVYTHAMYDVFLYLNTR